MGKKGLVIGIITAVVVIGALVAVGMNANRDSTSPASVNNGNEEQQKSAASQNEERIAALLGNDPDRMNNPEWRQTAQDILRTENTDNALLVIHSDTTWNAVVQDSDLVQKSVDGSGSKAIEVKCNPGGIFSHVVQKSTESGALNVYMAKGGHIIKQGGTSADYGVVSISGTC